jgi:hypothetical protein
MVVPVSLAEKEEDPATLFPLRKMLMTNSFYWIVRSKDFPGR